MDQSHVELLKMIADIIREYGVGVVIISGIILTLIPIVIIFGRIVVCKTMKQILEFEKKVQLSDIFDDKNDKDLVINNELDQLIYDLDCDKAYIYMVHDGISNLDGVPFNFISITHERVQVGLNASYKENQRIPASSFAYFLKGLRDDGDFFLSNIDELKGIDSGAYQMLKDANVKSLYLALLNNKITKRPLGFLGISYVKKETELDAKQIERLRNASLYISGCLMIDSTICTGDDQISIIKRF